MRVRNRANYITRKRICSFRQPEPDLCNNTYSGSGSGSGSGLTGWVASDWDGAGKSMQSLSGSMRIPPARQKMFLLLALSCALLTQSGAAAQNALESSPPTANTVQPGEDTSAAKAIGGTQPIQTPAARKLAQQILTAFGGMENLKRFHETPYRGMGKIEQVSTISGTSNNFDIEVFSKGVKQYCKIDLLGQPLITGYDGEVSWTQQGDQVFPADPQTTKQVAEDIKHGTLLLLSLDRPDMKIAVGKPRTVQGVMCEALVVTPDDGKPTTFYADQKTHVVLRSEYRGLDLEQGIDAEKAYEYRDYRLVDGTQQAFDTLEFTGGKRHSKVLFTTLVKEPGLSESIFSMPQEKSIARLKEGPVTIPFEYVNNEILVKVRINNQHDLRFILDTGATQSIVDEQAAKLFGTAKKSNLSMTTGSGSIKMNQMTLDTMALGDITLNSIPVAVANLQGFSEILQQRPAGLLGANILRRFLVTIDYDERKVTFSDPTNVVVPPNAHIVPTKPTLGTAGLAVNGTLDDKVKLTFLVDSGAAFNNVSESLVKPLLTTPLLPVGTLKGLDGHPVKIASLRFDTLELESLKVRHPIFSVAPPPSGKDPSGLIASGNIAILGNPMWSRFRLTVDYRNQRLILEETTKKRKETSILTRIDAVTMSLRRNKHYDQAVTAYRLLADEARQAGLVDAESQCHLWAALALNEKLAASKNSPAAAAILVDATSEFTKAHTLAQNANVRGKVLAYWGYHQLTEGRGVADVKSGREMIARAITIAPSEPAVFAVTGFMLKKLGVSNRSGVSAASVLDQALMLDPTNWLALWTKYKSCLSENKPETANLVALQLQRYYQGVAEVATLPTTASVSPSTPATAGATGAASAAQNGYQPSESAPASLTPPTVTPHTPGIRRVRLPNTVGEGSKNPATGQQKVSPIQSVPKSKSR